MIKLKKEDLVGKTLDELDSMRLVIDGAIAGADENAAIAAGMIGQKLIKRLTSDLNAIRTKYALIKGSPDDQLAALHRLQGREQQLSEELDNLTSAARIKRELGSNLELLTLAIEKGRKSEPDTR